MRYPIVALVTLPGVAIHCFFREECADQAPIPVQCNLFHQEDCEFM